MMRVFLVSFVVFLLGTGFGVMTTRYDPNEQGKSISRDVLSVVELCETSILSGSLPATDGWSSFQLVIPAMRSDAAFFQPDSTDLVVELRKAKFGQSEQLSCTINVGGSFAPLTDDVISVVLLELLQERADRIVSGEYERFPMTQLGNGMVLEGFVTREKLSKGCPIGIAISLIPQAPLLGLRVSVSDMFTWCD